MAMTDPEFHDRIAALRKITYREDYEAALHDLYAQSTDAHRAILREAQKRGELRPQQPWRNPADYDRSDLKGLQRVRHGLIAMSIYDSPEWKDDLRSIAFYYHSAELLGVDPNALLVEIAQMSSPALAKLIRGFVDRPLEAKSLHAWRLHIVQTPSGPVIDRLI
jgi:hypothetical protein